MARRKDGVGRALRRALGEPFALPEVEPREGGSSLLMNPRRQRVFEYVWNRPCAHLRRIARDLNIPPQSLRWHLLRLRDAKILDSRVVKGRTVYYAPWAIRDEDVERLAALTNGVRRTIVHMLGSGPKTQVAVFRSLKTYQQAVLPPLEDLTRLSLIRTWKDNGKRLYERGPTHAEMAEAYAAAQGERLDRLLAVLKHDGVSPKVQSRGPTEAIIQVSNGVDHSILRFRLAPDLG